MSGAVHGSFSHTALITVHSASVSAISGLGMMRASILYKCKEVKRNLYNCKFKGARKERRAPARRVPVTRPSWCSALQANIRLQSPSLTDPLRRSPVLPQSLQTHRIMPLRQTHPGFIGDQRAMIKRGSHQSQGPVNQKLPRRAHQQVRAANDFRDAHRRIVHDTRELVGGHVVIAPNHKIAEFLSGDKLLRPETSIRERNRFAIGHAKPPAAFAIADFRLFQIAARARVNRFVVILRMRRARGGLKILSRTNAWINESARLQFLASLAIQRIALALIIGSERPADIRPFLPFEAEPAQVFEHGRDESRFAARAVQVVVAQYQCAAGGARALLGDPERPRMPDMQQPCRRGRDASAITGILRRIHAGELTAKTWRDKDLIPLANKW